MAEKSGQNNLYAKIAKVRDTLNVFDHCTRNPEKYPLIANRINESLYKYRVEIIYLCYEIARKIEIKYQNPGNVPPSEVYLDLYLIIDLMKQLWRSKITVDRGLYNIPPKIQGFIQESVEYQHALSNLSGQYFGLLHLL